MLTQCLGVVFPARLVLRALHIDQHWTPQRVSYQLSISCDCRGHLLLAAPFVLLVGTVYFAVGIAVVVFAPLAEQNHG